MMRHAHHRHRRLERSGQDHAPQQIIPRLVARGIKTSTIKHAHHSFDIDQPGKDSHAHRMAGATEVVVGSGARWAIVHELRGEPEPTLAELVEKITPVDLVLVEGFKRGSHPKLEVHRASVGKPFLYPADPAIVAIASDEPLPNVRIPVVDLEDVEGISDILLRHAMPVAPSPR